MAGRRPKPTAIHALNGNPSRLNLAERTKNEPQPAPIAPACPDFLNADGKKEWARAIALLEPIGLATGADMAALAIYCQIYGRWAEASRMLLKHGSIMKAPNGTLKQSPYLPIAVKCEEQMRPYLVELGLTPASRSKIAVDGTTKEKGSRISKYLSS